MTTAETLTVATRASLIAPAGTGKTQLIAEAVGKFTSHRQLILTHTHAGVDALRRRLRDLKISADRYQVDTIAGWCLRFATAYPAHSGVELAQPKGDAWNGIYSGAAKLIQLSFSQDIIRASYAGCFVDEYQDCTLHQHAVIERIADTVPTRLLGDPLQGIFDFGSSRLVEWSQSVIPKFPAVPGPTIPWRWKTSNPQLGSFVTRARALLISGSPIDLSDAAVHIVPEKERPLQSAISVCHQLADLRDGRVIAIRRDPWRCADLSRSLAGRYSVVEAIDCQDLYQGAEKIAAAKGPDLAAAVVDIASKCFTSVGTAADPLLNLIRKGKRHRKTDRHAHQLSALWSVADGGTAKEVKNALLSLQSISSSVLHRRELFAALMEAVASCEGTSLADMPSAAWAVRDRDRHRGRSLPIYGVATPLVVKGLEFDYAVVLDIHTMNAAQAYVALSRAKKGLYIVTNSRTLTPRPWPTGWTEESRNLLRNLV